MDLGTEATYTFISSIESIVSIAAIIIGGGWVYMLFIKNRGHFPRATISTSYGHCLMTDGRRLLHVCIHIENTGEILLTLDKMFARISQVSPTPESVIGDDSRWSITKERQWGQLDKVEWDYGEGSSVVTDGQVDSDGPAELEPGESDAFHCDFIVDADLAIVRLNCYVKNASKANEKDIGWASTTFADLHSDETKLGTPTDVFTDEVVD